MVNPGLHRQARVTLSFLTDTWMGGGGPPLRPNNLAGPLKPPTVGLPARQDCVPVGMPRGWGWKPASLWKAGWAEI